MKYIALDICVNIANMFNKFTILFSTSVVCKVVTVIEGSTGCDRAESIIYLLTFISYIMLFILVKIAKK